MPLVFDIQRFCVNDGPGIRSTVFLKGCPLKCPWCHNPESNTYKPQLAYRADACVGCQACVAACPHNVHQFVNGEHHVDFSRCKACGACVAACPAHALSIYGHTMSVNEIMAEFAHDEDYYETSGGGITISGGEAMSHVNDTFAIAQAARSHGWQVCIETSGWGRPEDYKRLTPFVNLYLFDYKITGEHAYEDVIGIPWEHVYANLTAIGEAGGRVIIRCPLIPGYNVCDEHFSAIATLSRLPFVDHVEILPYHDFGVGKAKSIGSKQYIQNVEVPTKQEAEAWMARIQELGGVNIRKS